MYININNTEIYYESKSYTEYKISFNCSYSRLKILLLLYKSGAFLVIRLRLFIDSCLY